MCLLCCVHVLDFRKVHIYCIFIVKLQCAYKSVTIYQVMEAAAVPSAGGGVVPPTLMSVSGLVLLKTTQYFMHFSNIF